MTASPEPPALRIARVRFAGAVVLIVFAAAFALDLPRMSPMQSAWFDAMQRLSPRRVDTTPVTIVAIDDRSLAVLGRWPWPRTLLARLIANIDANKPAAIGIDIVMPEADALSPERALAQVGADFELKERLAALPSNDAVLAGALAAAPAVLVMAGALDATVEPLRAAPVLVRDAGGNADSAVRAIGALAQYPAALSSLAALTGSAHGWGLISVDDPKGIVRRIPLVANVAGTLVPGLAMEMWRVAAGAPALRLTTSGGRADGVAAGMQRIAVQPDGTVLPFFSRHEPDRFVSAVDVLQDRVDPVRLGRTFILIGITALALGDYVWTPIGEKMPGVEVHAQLLENINDNAFLVRPRWAPYAEAGAFAGVGLLLIAVTPLWPVRSSAALAVAGVAAYFALAYLVFRVDRMLLDAAYPAAAVGILFAMLLALQLAETTRHRKALQQVLQLEREASARVAGELQAARRIQLDTLPRAERIQDPRIQLAASMEPALEVGGDLYDFFVLDEHRLFFMLGDVSGKGLSASIFMAVSKALCKSTMLRSGGGDLGALVSQANAEVERDNPASFFVTAFAGVLDLRSGDLDYCNAGQENPWWKRHGVGIERLTEGGGPPLCVVDDFGYRTARVRLRPGDLVCVVSDGVTEASTPTGELYGTARVGHVLARVDSAQAAVDAIRDDVRRFAAGAEPADDMTVLALRWAMG